MKMSFLKINLVTLKNSAYVKIHIEDIEYHVTESDVTLKDVYINPAYIFMVQETEEDSRLPMSASMIQTIDGKTIFCSESIEELIERIQSLEFYR